MYVHHKHVCLSVHSGVLLRRRQVRVVRYLCQKAGRSITSWKESNLRDTIAPLEGKGEWNTETIAYVYQNSGFQQGDSNLFFSTFGEKDTTQTSEMCGGISLKKKIHIKNIYINRSMSIWHKPNFSLSKVRNRQDQTITHHWNHWSFFFFTLCKIETIVMLFHFPYFMIVYKWKII